MSPLWLTLPRSARTLPPGLGLSKSVIDRLNAGLVAPDPGAPPEAYRPSNIAAYLSGLAPAAGIVPV